MTHPEQNPGPLDTTHHFDQLFSYAQQAEAQDQRSLRDYIHLDPELEQQMQNYLREGYDEEWAMGMLHAALQPPDPETPHRFDLVKKAGHEHTMRRMRGPFEATGIRIGADIAGMIRLDRRNGQWNPLYIADVSAFAAAVRGCRTPDHEKAQQRASTILNDVVSDLLPRASLAIERGNPDAYNLAYPWDSKGCEARYDKYDPGPSFLNALMEEIAPGHQGQPTLQQELLRLGADPQYALALDHLYYANYSPTLRGAWAAAVSLGIYGEGNISDRFINIHAWDRVLNLLGYVTRQAPLAPYTSQLREKILDDIDTELNHPFDPVEDDGHHWSMDTMTTHDSVEDMMAKLFEDEINMAMQPPPPPMEEEETRRMRQRHRDRVVQLLTEARQKILNTIPSDQLPRAMPLPRRSQSQQQSGATPDLIAVYLRQLAAGLRGGVVGTPDAQSGPTAEGPSEDNDGQNLT